MNTTISLFNRLVAPRLPSIRRWVAAGTLHASEIDDNLQTVLTEIFLQLPPQLEDEAAEAWLQAFVRRRLQTFNYRHRRDRGRWAEAPTPDTFERMACPADDFDDLDVAIRPLRPAAPPCADAPTSAPRADRASATRLDCYADRALAAAVERLPPLQRRALCLHADGWTTGDIAQELGCTPRSALRHLERAKERMRRQYACGDLRRVGRMVPIGRVG